MDRLITLNGKTFKAVEFDFNTVCDLAEMGVQMDQIGRNPMSAMRAYIAICLHSTKEVAGALIQDHIINGGTLDDISQILIEKMENSDFFRNLNKTEEQEVTEDTTEKKTSRTKK